ncbi:MAG: hypothetical protein ACI4IK_01560 [Eubacterium sp.]
MPKGNRGGQGSISQSHTGATIVKGGTTFGGGNYTPFDDNDANAVRQTNSDVYDDPDFNYARKLYVSDATDGQGYSFSQNLNYKLDNGLPLDANEQFMADMLHLGVRPLGKDTVLYRAAHDDILKAMGIKDYTKMSDAQLKSLVGTELQTTSYMSTSYDVSKNPFVSGPQSGGREVQMEIRASSGTKVFLGAKSQAEIVTNVGTKLKLVDIKYDKDSNGNQRWATPRTKSRAMPVVRMIFEAM